MDRLWDTKPSVNQVKMLVPRHIREVGEHIRKRRSVSQEQLIGELNPIIRGWSAYYKTGVSTRVVSLLSVGTRRNKHNIQKLPDRPNMIGEGSRHSWRSLLPTGLF